ncbi:MAG: DNA primase [Chthonomonas sp.]|nr:DNA primase [Chthonomonas sp.]
MSDDVEKVRSRINIVNVIERRVNLKKTGRGFTGLCPFHDDKNPSFSVNPSTGTYRCWSCGAKGDVFNFVMELDRLTFREALEVLAAEAGVELSRRPSDPEIALRQRRQAAMNLAQEFFVDQFERSDLAKSYCDGRGLDSSVRKEWGLGFGPPSGDLLANHLKKAGYSLQECQELFLVEKDSSGGYFDRFRSRLVIPILDERGRLVAFGGRIIGDGIPKYINSSDTPLFSKRRTLYGMNIARSVMSESGRCVLVEGFLDVIACHRAGVKEAVASLGTSLSEEHVALIKRWAQEAVILYDADKAGQAAADRAEKMLTAQGVKVKIALMADGQDPDTLLRSGGPDAVLAAVASAVPPTEFRMEQLRQRMKPEHDEFWAEAFSILASAKSLLEIERYSTELAGLYPGIRDRVAAEKLIKREVLRRRKAPARAVVQTATKVPKAAVHASEGQVIRALLMPELRRAAFLALQEDLFFTGQGVQVASLLLAKWSDGPPSGAANQWVPGLDPEVQDVFAMLEAKAILSMSQESLADAINWLKQKKAERELQRIKGGLGEDASKLEIIQRSLEELKNKKS